MTPFKSATQPLCKCCGKPIPKATDWVDFNCDPEPIEGSGVKRGRSECPKTKAEAQALLNLTVLAVRKGKRRAYSTTTLEEGRFTNPAGARPFRSSTQTGETIISAASVWDGESYVEEHFCKLACSATFGMVMAKAGHCTVAYLEARKAQAMGAKAKAVKP